MSTLGAAPRRKVGIWFRYVTFGFIGDKFGRKMAYVVYLTVAAALILAYASTTNPLVLLLLGRVAFFGTGYFRGFGAITAEFYPTGFTYNIGRFASAVIPFTVGSLAGTHGFNVALSTTAIAFLLAAVAWIWIPETKGRQLA